MVVGPMPEQNNLLTALPVALRKRIFPRLNLVELKLGDVVCDSGQLPEYVYFPTSCIISLLYVMLNGSSADISVVGYDCMVGVAVFMGGESTPSQAVVHSNGFAYRMSSAELKDAFNADSEVRGLMLRYTQALITQMSQTAVSVCNRYHSIDQQLYRWLLLSLDRLPGKGLNMTQEFIANRLGVRREGVSEAAGKLQKLGAIQYHRGHITVVDRPVLEALCCEC